MATRKRLYQVKDFGETGKDLAPNPDHGTPIYADNIDPALDRAESLATQTGHWFIVANDRGRNIAKFGPNGEHIHLGY